MSVKRRISVSQRFLLINLAISDLILLLNAPLKVCLEWVNYKFAEIGPAWRFRAFTNNFKPELPGAHFNFKLEQKSSMKSGIYLQVLPWYKTSMFFHFYSDHCSHSWRPLLGDNNWTSAGRKMFVVVEKYY